jgi:hypothetical protein
MDTLITAGGRALSAGEMLAFLADGESWSTSALSLALGTSARTVQRALDALAATGKAQSYGRGRARRWTARPVPDFTTTLLLPGPLPGAVRRPKRRSWGGVSVVVAGFRDTLRTRLREAHR